MLRPGNLVNQPPATSSTIPIHRAVDGQAREILDKARAGVFVEPEDVPGLVQAIQKLAVNPELCATFGGNGREYILRSFSRKQTAVAYIEILRALVPGSAS